MGKIKPLLPTLREKKRYLAFELLSNKPLGKDITSKLLEKMKSILGIFDSAGAGIIPVEYDERNQKGILRIATEYSDRVRMAMIMIRDIEKTQVLPRTLGISGTLKNAREKYMD